MWEIVSRFGRYGYGKQIPQNQTANPWYHPPELPLYAICLCQSMQKMLVKFSRSMQQNYEPAN